MAGAIQRLLALQRFCCSIREQDDLASAVIMRSC
jgi:hypothetical protein